MKKYLPFFIATIFFMVGCAENQVENNDRTIPENTNDKTTRVILTHNNTPPFLNRFDNPECEQIFSNDPAATTVQYSNTDKGITFSVPYNEQWGNEKYKVTAYNEVKNDNGNLEYVEFGALKNFGNCEWGRLYSMRFLPAKGALEVIDAIQDHQSTEAISINPSTTEINGLTVVKYATTGKCYHPAIQVIGEKYNYEFVSTCSPLAEQDMEILEEIVKSVQLTTNTPENAIQTSNDLVIDAQSKEYSFDECGTLEKYKSYPFFVDLQKLKLWQNEIEVDELCYAEGEKIVIGIVGADYCRLGNIFKYDVESSQVTFANTDLVKQKDDGCSFSLSSFGKRQGPFIEVLGGGGDGGYMAKTTYRYYYDANVLDLVHICDNNVNGQFIDKMTNCKDL